VLLSPLQASTIAERGQLLNDYFTYSLYVNVCRSLFERHKLLLSFMLGVQTLQHGGNIDSKEWRFLLAGPSSTGNQRRSSTAGTQGDVLANPAPDWLTEKSWAELLGVSQLPAFNGFDEHVAQNLEHYKAIFDSSEVSLVQSPARMLTSTTIVV
jgi:dynein heavy chain